MVQQTERELVRQQASVLVLGSVPELHIELQMVPELELQQALGLVSALALVRHRAPHTAPGEEPQRVWEPQLRHLPQQEPVQELVFVE